MRIVTWNINSIRIRGEILTAIVKELRPDILCLQETKTPDAQFPFSLCHDLGFPHCAISGQPSYNGVAILSRTAFSDQATYFWCDRPDARHIMVKTCGVEIHNLYIPAGGDTPNIETNPKFAHKLKMLREIGQWFQQNRSPEQPLILAGDLNIAPSEYDVWSHLQMKKRVSHTPIECATLKEFQSSLGWVDAMRHFHPEPKKLFSWWSYRARDWKTSNRGLRLDHLWVTPALSNRLLNATIAQEFRSFARPSDHAPLLVELSP